MQLDDLGWKAAGAVAALWLTLLSWIGNKTDRRIEDNGKRIDDLAAGKADVLDLQDAITEWRLDRVRGDKGREELHEKINEVAQGVARIEGKLGI